jgi:hypothetical protein
MNYADLFRVTLPETALEVAALLVLVVDLGLPAQGRAEVRVAVAALLGVAGCGAAIVGVAVQGSAVWLQWTRTNCCLHGGFVQVAQTGNPGSDGADAAAADRFGFHQACGRVVAVVLMAATGGLLIAGAQDLLVIFVGLELLSLGLYILTAFAKSSGKSAEAAMKYYLVRRNVGGVSAVWFQLFLWAERHDKSHRLIQDRIIGDQGRVRCFMWRGFWLLPGSVSRLRRCRFIFGRRIPMKARPLRPRRLSLPSPRWPALRCSSHNQLELVTDARLAISWPPLGRRLEQFAAALYQTWPNWP